MAKAILVTKSGQSEVFDLLKMYKVILLASNEHFLPEGVEKQTLVKIGLNLINIKVHPEDIEEAISKQLILEVNGRIFVDPRIIYAVKNELGSITNPLREVLDGFTVEMGTGIIRCSNISTDYYQMFNFPEDFIIEVEETYALWSRSTGKQSESESNKREADRRLSKAFEKMLQDTEFHFEIAEE